MSKRVWYHLRVRELVSPGRWVKKSKFYEGRRSSDAVRQYLKRNGSKEHTIMWCEKDKRHDPDRFVSQTERLWQDIRREQDMERRRGRFSDVKGFFSLGGELLQELRQSEKEKAVKRRGYDRQLREVTD